MRNDYLKIFEKYGLYFGRCLGSKSGYRKFHPNHLIIFNARIYTKGIYEIYKDSKIRDFLKGQEDEVYYGDIDLNENIYDLYKIHLEIGEALVITSESGNKIVEIGDSLDRHWIGQVHKEGKAGGISLEDLEK